MASPAFPSGGIGSPAIVRVLVDTNVVLDWLFDRKPWSDEARPLWDARNAGRVVAYLPASALTDIFYIARRIEGIDVALKAVDQILATFGLVAVDGPLVRQARALPGNDFEDSIQIACAMAAQLDLIITRNLKDFSASPIRAIEPPRIQQYLAAP